jgi:hypothetical protein
MIPRSVGAPTTRGRRLRLVVSLLVLTAAVLPAVAQATFTAPVFLSVDKKDSFEPKVALDPSGRAITAWDQYDGVALRVQARFRAAAGGLSTTQTLSAAGLDAFDPQVAINGANGNSFIVWTQFDGTHPTDPKCCDRIMARTRALSGTLGPVLTLSAAGQDAEEAQVAIDKNGNAIVVWERFDGTKFIVQSRTVSASGALGTVQALSGTGQTAFSPQVAFDGSNNAHIVWTRFDGSTTTCCDRIQARTRLSSGSLTAVQTLSDATKDADQPQIGVPTNGKAVIVWQRYDGTSGTPHCCNRIQSRTRTASGSLGTVQTLSVGTQNSFSPAVSVNGAGATIVAWERYDGSQPSIPCCERIQSRPISASGTLGATQTLSLAGFDAFGAQAGIDTNGNSVISWSRNDGTNFRVQARTRASGGALGAVQTLSAAGTQAYNNKLAVNPSGKALAVWEFYGTNTRIQLSAGP